MFESLREEVTLRKKLLFTILTFVPILAIFINSNTLKSPSVGFLALIIYFLATGETLGRAFFDDEKPFFRLAFGLFTSMVLLTLAGMITISLFQFEMWYILGMVFSGATTSILNQVWVKYDMPERRVNNKKKTPLTERWYVKVIYVAYAISFVICFLMLFNERSGWIIARPSIWSVIPSIFVRMYFVATALLTAIILLPGSRALKLLFIGVHSTFSLLFIPIILYPGVISPEAWYDLGRSRVMLQVVRLTYATRAYGIMQFARAFNSLLKGFSVQLLTVFLADVLNVDMYWSNILLVPVLWGFFVPLTSYKLTEMIGGSKRASTFAAFITIPNFYFLSWGKLSISDSLGNLFSIVALYLSLRYLSPHKTRVFFPIFLTLAVITATHFLPTIIFVSFFILAFVLKRYERLRIRSPISASLLLFISFIASVFLLPVSLIARGVAFPALGESAFDINRLLGSSIWAVILGVLEETPAKEAFFYYTIFPLLGLIGAVYAIKKPRFSRTLCIFLFLTLWVSLAEFRLLSFAFSGGLFGAGRLNFFRDISALPFLAVAIDAVARSFLSNAKNTTSSFRWRNIAVGTLICLSLSSWATYMVYDNYVYYTGGFMGSSYEVDAIKYIDEHTDSRYVAYVIGNTETIAWGFIGYPYPPGKTYVLATKVPSVSDMYNEMETANADVGYFIAPSFGLADFDKIINQMSRIFGLFHVMDTELGKIYIFDYKIPPLPKSSNVTAFYWDTPPTYYIQNDLMRIIINPEFKSFSVQDFWGGLFESIELNDTLVGGSSIGNLTSIEYFDASGNNWAEWAQQVEIQPADQFQFKLRFENASLVGLVERGKGGVQLYWENDQASTLSLNIGDFKRLYIPGLIGGADSYDVNSREYGFLYTNSLTNNVTLRPAYGSSVESSSLTYSQIVKYGGFNMTEGYMWYDLYVHNTADIDQWSYIEVYLPDEVYMGSFAPLYYSLDEGKTWVYSPQNVEAGGAIPVKTVKGTEVNWIFTLPRSGSKTPTEWRSYLQGNGGAPVLPQNFSESGGAQNKIIYGLFLPANDRALVRIGSSVYYFHPLKLSYVFEDSSNPSYGLQNMKEGLIKYYTSGTSEYVGGLTFTGNTTSLTILQDETGKISSMLIKMPSNATFSLLATTGVDTTIDANDDGIPDRI